MQYLILPAGDSSFNVTTQDVTVFEGPEIVLQTEENDHTSQIRAKRQKLDHLSNYEKLSRRKLKNRVAAQVARDKKKARMDDLESIVENLQQENKRLTAENERLQAENAALSSRETVTEGSRNFSSTKQVFPVESAELIHGPLPQEQGNILFVIVAILLQLVSNPQFKILEDQSKGHCLQKLKFSPPPANRRFLETKNKKQPP